LECIALLTSAAVFLSSTSAMAESNTSGNADLNRRSQFQDVLQQLNNTRGCELRDKPSLTEDTSADLQLENQMESLGAVKLDQEQVDALKSIPSATSAAASSTLLKAIPLVTPTTPDSTTYTNWWMLTYTYNGYNVKEVYAQAKAVGSPLWHSSSAVNAGISNVVINTATTIMTEYAEKALGLIPVVAWTPYELFISDFQNNQSITTNCYYINYADLSTVCFSYAKPVSKSDSYWVETYVSNYVQVASSQDLYTVNNGTLVHHHKDTSNTQYATSYASAAYAVQGYSGRLTSYISVIEFKNLYGNVVLSDDLTCPIAPYQIE
jgi:hypothetical protein